MRRALLKNGKEEIRRMKNKHKKGFVAMFLIVPLVLGCAGIAHAVQRERVYVTGAKDI